MTLKHCRIPKFRQIMGECCTKEWVAKIPGYGNEGEDGDMWVLMELKDLSEYCEELEDMWEVRLYDAFADIDWHERSNWDEELVRQFFMNEPPFFETMGNDPLVLMHEATVYAALTY